LILRAAGYKVTRKLTQNCYCCN